MICNDLPGRVAALEDAVIEIRASLNEMQNKEITMGSIIFDILLYAACFAGGATITCYLVLRAIGGPL